MLLSHKRNDDNRNASIHLKVALVTEESTYEMYLFFLKVKNKDIE